MKGITTIAIDAFRAVEAIPSSIYNSTKRFKLIQ